MAESCKLGSLENSAMFHLQDDFSPHWEAGPRDLCRISFVHHMWAFWLGHQIEKLFASCPQQIRFTSPQPPSDGFVMLHLQAYFVSTQ